MEWLRSGDRNTKIFHSKVSKHFKKNRIRGSEDPSGSWIMKDKDITKEVERYFNDVLQTIVGGDEANSWIVPSLGKRLKKLFSVWVLQKLQVRMDFMHSFFKRIGSWWVAT